MLSRATLDRLDARWGDEFGVTPAYWAGGRVDVAPRSHEDGWNGLLVHRRGEACVVQGPPGLGAQVARWIAGRSPDVLIDPAYWAGTLGPRFGRAIGPAWLGYVDAGSFVPPTGPTAALLADEAPLAALAAACGPTGWEHGGIHAGGGPIYGVFEGERLLAACMIARWPGRIAHLCVATDPQARGRGLGQAVVGAAAAAALADGQLTQYRTLAANAPSVGLAARLGFTLYATTVAVRLAAAEEA